MCQAGRFSRRRPGNAGTVGPVAGPGVKASHTPGPGLCCSVPRPDHIELGDRRDGVRIPILYEDRSVLAVDKPAGWMLVPFNWQKTSWNLQAAITSAIRSGAFWSRSRHLRFLQYVHRLDAETTGILLFGKSRGAVETLSDLFASRRMEKRYLAIVTGVPGNSDWTCEVPLGPEPDVIGRVRADARGGKPATTRFRVLETRGDRTLVEARPVTGRTHQIRVHLLHAGHPIVGDDLYAPPGERPTRRTVRHAASFPMGLRAVELRYRDPFRRQPVGIHAPTEAFLKSFGFEGAPSD